MIMHGFSRKIGLAALSILLLLGSVLSFPVTPVHAATDGVYEYEDLGGGTARITGYTGPTGGNVVIPNQVGGLTVVEIGWDAFKDKQMTSITIPNSVTTIEQGAFENNALTSLTLPSSLTTIESFAFKDNQLTSLTIPDGVTTVGQSAFEANVLTNLNLPSSLTTIGSFAFMHNELASLTLPDGVTTVEQSAFEANVLTNLNLPSSLTTIGSSSFKNNQLASLTLPVGVTTVGQSAFEANVLTNLNLPSSLTTIGSFAFMHNELATLTLPDGVTTVGQSAFEANVLTNLNLPSSLTTIGSSSFKNNELASLTIPNGVTTIGGGAFENNALTNLTLPGSLTTISYNAFKNNELASLTIPNGVTTIEGEAFERNVLTSVTLPGSLTTISYSAFKNNELASLTIPNGVTTIGGGAFENNPILSDVLVLSQTVDFLNNSIFNSTSSNLALYGYASSTSETFATGNGYRFQSITAELADLELNIGGLTFSPTISTFNLMTNANAVIVTPTPVVPFSEVKVAGEVVPYGADSSPIELVEGTTTITVDVKAPDNSEEEYTIVFEADHTSPFIGYANILLTPTNENVTFTVEATDTGSGLSAFKWAIGNQVTAFFADGGEDVTDHDFTVSENRTYTFYARDNVGNEALSTITVSNIDRSIPTIDLTISPTNSTNGNVTVTVDAEDTGSGLSELKWASGNEGTAFFATAGDTIVGNEFIVTENGTYTVYARDKAGNEAVETITINNIDRNVPTIDLTASPTASTNGNVTVTVAVYAASGISELKWTAGHEGIAFFATGGEAIVGNEFTVTANGTYTAYAKDEAGNEAVKSIDVMNIDRIGPTIGLTANPTTSTNGNVTVTVAVYANSGISELKWAAGNEGTVFFATSGEAIVGNEFTVTANGTYTVYARDNAGNDAVETITISNIVTSSPTPPSTPDPDDEEDSPEESDPRTIISTDPGVIIIEVAPRDIKEVPKGNGGFKEVVTLPDEVWNEIPKLLDKDDRPVIRVIINDHLPDVEVHVPGKRMTEVLDANPNVVFDMQLNGSSFQLQVNVLDLEQLAKQLGIAVDDMNVIIKISALAGETKEDFILATEEQGMTLLSEVIEFQLIISGGEESVEITDFGGTYMTKSIVLDEQFANRNYMAVLYDPDGRTFTNVPAIMARRSNGQQDAVIQMPHNSIYAVVETDRVDFADMQGHWAESEVEQLGSKQIVRGMTIHDYAPNRNITRAEFASLLVRALGIKTDRTGAGDVFQDVAIASWYATEVEAAFRAGLVSGISRAHFAPEAQITREQIAVMLMNARTLVNDESHAAGQLPNPLTPFADASEVSAWARDAMSEAVASKLIQGLSTDRLAPDSLATRAQAAVMLHRLLVMIEFLD
jgi:hypothetical protein